MHLQNENTFREATLILQMLWCPPAWLVGCVIGCQPHTVLFSCLCKYDKSDQLQNDAWITVTGKFTKGEYNGKPEPQIVVETITSAQPVNGYVYPY